MRPRQLVALRRAFVDGGAQAGALVVGQHDGVAQGLRVEGVLVVGVGQRRALLGVVAAAWVRPRSSAGRGTPRASPSGCRRCRAGPTRRARRGRTRGPGRSSSRGRPPRGVRGLLGAQVGGQLDVATRAVRVQDVAVAVDLQDGVPELRDGLHQGGEDPHRVHVGPQALEVQADPEGAVTHRERTAMARDMVGRSTTCGCGSTCAVRPHRASIALAAPGVRVTRASAAGTSTSSCSSCRRRSWWWGLRRSCTVKTKGVPRSRSTPVSSRRVSGVAASKPKCRWKRSIRPCRAQAGSSRTGGHHVAPAGRSGWPGWGSTSRHAAAAGGGEVSYVDVTRGHGGDGQGRSSDLLRGLAEPTWCVVPGSGAFTAISTPRAGTARWQYWFPA